MGEKDRRRERGINYLSYLWEEKTEKRLREVRGEKRRRLESY